MVPNCPLPVPLVPHENAGRHRVDVMVGVGREVKVRVMVAVAWGMITVGVFVAWTVGTAVTGAAISCLMHPAEMTAYKIDETIIARNAVNSLSLIFPPGKVKHPRF